MFISVELFRCVCICIFGHVCVYACVRAYTYICGQEKWKRQYNAVSEKTKSISRVQIYKCEHGDENPFTGNRI